MHLRVYVWRSTWYLHLMWFIFIKKNIKRNNMYTYRGMAQQVSALGS
jgi:hypothetical protein